MTGDRDDPPAEAYGRVTDAERFAVLHEWAANLLDRLVEDYDVVRTDDIVMDDHGSSTSTVTLTPSLPDAATVRITFIAFPGVTLSCGRWSDESYPHCGCDASDDLLDELITRVEAVVMGGFSEELTSGAERWLRTSVRTLRERGTSAELIEPEQYARYGAPGCFDWRPWPRPGQRRSRFPIVRSGTRVVSRTSLVEQPAMRVGRDHSPQTNPQRHS